MYLLSKYIDSNQLGYICLASHPSPTDLSPESLDLVPFLAQNSVYKLRGGETGSM